MDANLINADNYPIGNNRVIKLISREKLPKLSKGITIFSVGGKEIVVGKEDLDTDTGCFGRSKYGELIQIIDVETKKEKSHGTTTKAKKKS
jgi:hypothetical protein